MMVPQRIRMTMNKQIESIQQSVGGIGDTVDMIANRANCRFLWCRTMEMVMRNSLDMRRLISNQNENSTFHN